MANVWKRLFAVCGVLSICGCVATSGQQKVQANENELPAIAYAKQVIKNAPDITRRNASLLQGARLRDEGDYRVFTANFYRPHKEGQEHISAMFARFCRELGGTVYYRGWVLCKQGSDDEEQVKFILADEFKLEWGSALGVRAKYVERIDLSVYEPVGAPSPRFLQAMRDNGCPITKAEYDAYVKAAWARSREQSAAREAQEKKRKEEEAAKALVAPLEAPTVSVTPSVQRSTSPLQKAFDK